MAKPVTLRRFFRRFPNDAACLEHLFDVRFGQGHECPRCGRSARWYPIRTERAYSCEWCGHHIHPTAGTLLEKTHTPLIEWFYVMFRFTAVTDAISAKQIERELGCTYKTAWRMCCLARKHLGAVDGDWSAGEERTAPDPDKLVTGR